MAFAIHINMYVDTIYQHKLAVDMRVPSFLTPLPPPSPPHPSRLSQSTRFELPASYSKFPLAIYFTYGNGYVAMLLSQFIPPTPFPTVSISLFLMFASLLLFCK